MNNYLFKQTFFLFVIIGFLDFIANKFYFYYTIWWFDMIMHFSAGVCVGMTILLTYFYFYKVKEVSFLKTVLMAIIGVAVVGLLWEVYELLIRVTSFDDGVAYYTDTASDLILDICGGILGSLYARRLLSK